MKRPFLTIPCLLTMVACGGSSDGIQRYASLELEAEYPHALSYLSGVRELSNGRILAADPISQVLLRIDFESGTADTLGRQGSGPQEYEVPDQVFPLPGDSTLLVDLGNSRLIVVDPDGTFVEWTPMSRSIGERRPRTIIPTDVDAAGNLYDGGYYSPDAPQDTFSLRRIDRATWQETEVATAWHTAFERPEPGAKRPMLVLYDEWAVGSDGRVVVVRAHGYSVEWYFPDGRVVHGPPNEIETFPVGAAEKQTELDNYVATVTIGRTTVDDDGVRSTQMSRGMPPGSRPGVDDFAWPETLPLLAGGRTRVSPRGYAWVERLMPAGNPGRIEVFNDQGIREGFIELPAHTKLIGFGAADEPGSTVYATRTDDLGLVWLQRYRVVSSAQ